MKSNSKTLGDIIKAVDERNSDEKTKEVLGISINKEFMPSVANIIGTDLSKYKLLRKSRFAFNSMHTGRDERLPIALFKRDDIAIVSPAYFMFEIKNKDEVDEDYLMIWFQRPEFDHTCWYMTDASVRGGLSWDDFCRISIELPSIEEQRKIVHDYKVITNRIELLKKINEQISTLSKTIYNHWFVDFSHFKNCDMIESKNCRIPKGWKLGRLKDIMTYAGGQQPPSEEFVFEPQDGYIRLVQIRDYETDKYATYIPIDSKNKLCEEHDIMIARYGASLGRICFGLSGAYNVALAKVFPNKHYYREYLRCFLNTDNFYNGINGSGERSAQQGFNQEGMDSFLIPIPPDDVFKDFEKIMSPLFEYQLSIRKSLIDLYKIEQMIVAIMAKGGDDNAI